MHNLFARSLIVPLLAATLLTFAAQDAAADEVFELNNGVVLKGYVMREDGDELVIRLTGFAEPSTVTVQRRQIRKRYASGLPTSSTRPLAPSVFTTARSGGADLASSYRRPDLEQVESTQALTQAEPDIQDESFLDRIARLARMSVPESAHARATLGVLLGVVLFLLIAGGARLADVDDAGFFATATLAVLFAGVLAADVLQYEYLLRADRALYVLPAQALGWIVSARLLLVGSLGRCVLVLGFVSVSLMTVAFVTGAVLVAI